MQHYKFMVLTNPVAGQEDEYNHWYNEQHIPDVLKVPGFVAAQRFLATDEGRQNGHKYLAIYEIESGDINQTMAELKSRVGGPLMQTSPALDRAGVSATVFGPLTKRFTA